MANRYGEAALMAVRMELDGKALSPGERWEDAVRKLYPNSVTSQRKACPRGAFLGLCEAGLVRGIAAGTHGSPSPNKDYAVMAAGLLASGTHTTVTQLWGAVGERKTHNSQMDVVLALWKNGLIVSER